MPYVSDHVKEVVRELWRRDVRCKGDAVTAGVATLLKDPDLHDRLPEILRTAVETAYDAVCSQLRREFRSRGDVQPRGAALGSQKEMDEAAAVIETMLDFPLNGQPLGSLTPVEARLILDRKIDQTAGQMRTYHALRGMVDACRRPNVTIAKQMSAARAEKLYREGLR